MKKKAKAAGRKASGKTRGKRVRSLKARADEARDWSAEVGTMYKPIKKPVTLRLDADVVAWFKVQGKGYQTRINSTLRRVMREEKKR
jgi:uncharacterized protein (DUF4415 family)